MNELAVIEQMPIIKEKMKEIGKNLQERLDNLKLDDLVCTEETLTNVKELRADLNKEIKEYEIQRKDIKNKILAPYEAFNDVYEMNIKSKYQVAIDTLDGKIHRIEDGIKDNTKTKAIEFFEEYRTSKLIKSDWLSFDELNIKVGISQLTQKGELIKKVKDEIKNAVDSVSECINSISTMDDSKEILAEYIKCKNLSQAIKIVNDRHVILDTLKQAEEENQKAIEQDMKVIEQVDEVLQAPVEEDVIDGQMTIEDVIPEDKKEEIYESKFKVRTKKYEDLVFLVNVMKERGIEYEPITD